jgi:hypothetical protein
MSTYKIRGESNFSVQAESFSAAAKFLFSSLARSRYGKKATLSSVGMDAGSFDGKDEIWKADVCFFDSKNEIYYVGRIYETIFKIN